MQHRLTNFNRYVYVSRNNGASDRGIFATFPSGGNGRRFMAGYAIVIKTTAHSVTSSSLFIHASLRFNFTDYGFFVMPRSRFITKTHYIIPSGPFAVTVNCTRPEREQRV